MRERVPVGNASGYRGNLRAGTVVGENSILCIVGITGHPLRVAIGGTRIYKCYCTAGPLRKSDLCYQERSACTIVDMDMNVRGPALVPAGKDRGECYGTGRICCLAATQKMHGGIVSSLHRSAAVFGIIAVFVAMPDINDGTGKRCAARIGILNCDPDGKQDAGAIEADVGANK